MIKKWMGVHHWLYPLPFCNATRSRRGHRRHPSINRRHLLLIQTSMGFLYLAIKIPQAITMTIFTNTASHLVSLILAALSHLGLFKSPPDPDDYTSSSGNYVLILDGSSPSLLPVPVHVVTASIKNKVPIIPYSDFAHRFGGIDKAVCTVCLDSIHYNNPIRELLNCKHVFHRECLDRWVDEGQVTCPLCRSMLLPSKKLLSSSSVSAAGNVNLGNL